MKIVFILLSACMLFSNSALATTETIFGPKSFSSKPQGATYQDSFSSSIANADGVLTVVNGDGKDYEIKDCAKLPVLKKLECIAIAALSELSKPMQIEVSLNGQVLVSSTKLPQQQGKYQTAIKVQKANNLKVTVKGLWTSYVTVDVKAQTQTQNQPPIARITATPTSGIAPELITLSGINSSDPDNDAITQYTWDFADGSFGTGSIVTHNFQAAGTYNVKLTVTDSKGGQGSAIQSIVIKANQLPIANFLATTDTALGVLKAHFDGTASTDLDGQIVSFVYEFGDGTFATTSVADHVYNQGGTYQVKLTVTDNKNATTTKIISLLIQDTTPPILNVTSPVDGDTIQDGRIKIAGTSNEKLSSVSAFTAQGLEVPIALSSDQMSYSGSSSLAIFGSEDITITAQDIAGNRSSITKRVYFNSSLFWSYSECSTQSEGL